MLSLADVKALQEIVELANPCTRGADFVSGLAARDCSGKLRPYQYAVVSSELEHAKRLPDVAWNSADRGDLAGNKGRDRLEIAKRQKQLMKEILC